MTKAQRRALLLEAARRANWDALHGPIHLRRGQFNPSNVSTGAEYSKELSQDSHRSSEDLAQHGSGVDGSSAA